MEKIILDTDIGSDIDDAVCLAYLLAQPQCDLLGITTVSGQPVERAKLASALCIEAGRDIPIFAGCEHPLLVENRQPITPQSSMLTRWKHQSEFPNNGAIEFLRDTIRANPGEVTLLGIGPMTNLAVLFTIDPEIPSLLKSLVMMIGVFDPMTPTIHPVEWNALCDPHAAAKVYQVAPRVHRSIGLDVTLQVSMPAAEVRQRFTRGLLRPVLDFAEVWFTERPTIIFHDPLAAVTLFDDQVCSFTRGTVNVDLHSDLLAGYTHWTPSQDGAHDVTFRVDKERFFAEYFGKVAP
jgi:purine nucleosidase